MGSVSISIAIFSAPAGSVALKTAFCIVEKVHDAKISCI
jgi:hypothetical protein